MLVEKDRGYHLVANHAYGICHKCDSVVHKQRCFNYPELNAFCSFACCRKCLDCKCISDPTFAIRVLSESISDDDRLDRKRRMEWELQGIATPTF